MLFDHLGFTVSNLVAAKAFRVPRPGAVTVCFAGRSGAAFRVQHFPHTRGTLHG